MWLRVLIVIGIYCVISNPTFAQPTGYQVPTSPIGNLLEGAFESEAAASGSALTVSGASADAAFSGALAAVEGDAIALGGAAIAGNPVTWLGVGAFAAGAAGYCITMGCDLSNAANYPAASILNLLPLNPYGSPYPIPSGNQFFIGGDAQTGLTIVGPTADAVAQQVAQSLMSKTGGSVTSCPGVVTQLTSTEWQEVCQVKTSSGSKTTITASVFSSTKYSSPGFSCMQETFEPPGTTTTLSCSQGVGPTSPAPSNTIMNQNANQASSSQLAEPVDPQFLANLAELARQAAAAGRSGVGSSASTGTPSSGSFQAAAQATPPITATAIKEEEARTGIYPTLADLFKPVVTGAVVVSNSNGTYTPSGTAVTNASQTLTPASTSQEQALGNRCGNLLAGENPCVTTLDMTFNPATGSWEYQEIDPNDPTKATSLTTTLIKNLGPILKATDTLLQNSALQDGAKTITSTGVQTNPLTSPQTAVQNLMKTQDPTLTQTNTQLTPPNRPPLTLPFNEWPTVMQAFNTDAPDLGGGACPTVSFYSVVLSKQLTISAQCIVMDSLKPYMAYVLPPTYLLMALFFIMAA